MSTVLGTANWLLLAFSMASAVVRQALRPMTWRRPVRLEFWRFMELVCLRNLAAVLVAAALVGLTLISQGLYWLEEFGQSDAVGRVIVFVVVREIGPLIVGLLALGSGGLVMLGELAALRQSGQLEALDRQGIDPFLLLVVPRSVALIFAIFTHSILFIVVALVTGFTVAQATGATAIPPAQFLVSMMTSLGTAGYVILPAKAFATGITIATTCCLTALEGGAAKRGSAVLTANGFLRAICGVLLVNALISLAV